MAEAINSPLLQMVGIGKRFPGVIALDSVSLEVMPGEIVGLIGENGAGKSTLMKILGGVYQPDSGTILIEGKPTKIGSVRAAIDLGISFIHQELAILDNLDVAANVYLGREPRRGGPLNLIDRAAIQANTETFLRRLGMNFSSRTPMSALSLAQQQMVEIAKALSLDSRLLIMDEPTSSLTLTETERLLEVAQELRAQGVSIIYISHRLGEIHQIADRVVGLRDGRTVGTLAREEISHERMVSLMVGRDLRHFYAAPESGKSLPGLSLQGLRTPRYPNVPITMEIQRGEILGMAGLVGAGRTELACTLFGVDKPVGGTIVWEGKTLTIRSPQDAIHQGIFLVPEDRRGTGLIVDMLIRENETLPSLRRFAPGGLIRRQAEREAATEVSARLRVKAPSVETRASNLSGGNQQKVVLAKWIAMEPKVMIFDEPTRGIDVGAKAEIYQLMRKLADQGVAVLMISSDMEEVLGVSDRVAVMHEGHLAGILDREQCTQETIMRLAVGGK